MEPALIIAFSLYLCVLIAIGFAAYKKQKTAEDYLLGGRSSSFWVTALSAHASDMSSWLFMGFPAALYINGLQECWTAVGLLLGMFMTWQFIAPKLRQTTEKYKALTLSSYFARHFHDTYGSIRIVTALMSLIFFTFYIMAGLRSMGIISEFVFGTNYQINILTSSVIIISYIFLGGYTAVAWNDCFQALFLLSMIVLVPSVAFFHMGGRATLYEVALTQKELFQLLPGYSLTSILGILVTALSWGLGYFGQPHILNKFMALDNASHMKKAQYVGMIWQIISLSAATAVGIIGIAFFVHGGLENSELIFISMTKQLFNPFFSGIILCAILAAIISTIDSQVLVFASVFSQDIYAQFINSHAQEKDTIFVSKMSVVFICALAYLASSYEMRSIYTLVKYAWSGLGSSFGPLLLTSLYYKNITHSGALAGIIAGGITAALWPHFGPFLQGSPLIPGFVISLCFIFGVSLLSEKK